MLTLFVPYSCFIEQYFSVTDKGCGKRMDLKLKPVFMVDFLAILHCVQNVSV